jgi:hypothetical protein
VHSTRSASDKVYQLLAHGRWFSPGTPASSTTKAGRHDIAEILLKVALSIINKIKLNQRFFYCILDSVAFSFYIMIECSLKAFTFLLFIKMICIYLLLI